MGDFEKFRDSIGILAEMLVIFWNAVRAAGANEETAYILTTIFLETMREEE